MKIQSFESFKYDGGSEDEKSLIEQIFMDVYDHFGNLTIRFASSSKSQSYSDFLSPINDICRSAKRLSYNSIQNIGYNILINYHVKNESFFNVKELEESKKIDEMFLSCMRRSDKYGYLPILHRTEYGTIEISLLKKNPTEKDKFFALESLMERYDLKFKWVNGYEFLDINIKTESVPGIYEDGILTDKEIEELLLLEYSSKEEIPPHHVRYKNPKSKYIDL